MSKSFEFTRAIVREPGKSVVNGLRDDPSRTPTYDGVAREHAAYVAALREAGLTVESLPPLESFPDSVFVEDPALVFPEGAILLRPGAPSRTAEREHMRRALETYFGSALELGEGEYVDGGDVLVTPKRVFIGLSRRTNRAGAEALAEKLKTLGRGAAIVETPSGVLHLKSASSLMDEETILATPAMERSGAFSAFRTIVTAKGEDDAANALRVNDTLFLGSRYPGTLERLEKQGFSVHSLAIDEVAKLDAGLSCMSLRW
jgi:dimethylargininase